jgi:hypothetical protein
MAIRDLIDISIGELMGLATALVIAIIVIYRRFRSLSSIDFRLNPPPVPRVHRLFLPSTDDQRLADFGVSGMAAARPSAIEWDGLGDDCRG